MAPSQNTELNYFKLADMRNILQSTDEWLRHRIRSYVWKSWKKVGARFKNLVRCGIDRWRAWQWANTRGGYWNTAGSPILCRAMNNERLKLLRNRRMPNGTYGGVRGRKTKVGRKLLRFPPTRFICILYRWI